MIRQDQSVAENSSAVQAGRDVVNNGYNHSQMIEIINAVSQKILVHSSLAKDLIERRLSEFRQEILREFFRDGAVGKSEALSDPDVNFSLADAFRQYARSGEDGLKRTLVDLLIKRSVERSDSRRAKILNESIGLSGKLTKEDISVLAILFSVNNIRFGNGNYLNGLKILEESLLNFSINVQENIESVRYLQSISCVDISVIPGDSLFQKIKSNYEATISTGILVSDVAKLIGSEGLERLRGHVVDIESGLISIVFKNKKEASRIIKDNFGNDKIYPELLSLIMNSYYSDADLEVLIHEHCPSGSSFIELWEKSGMQQSSLTVLGVTLGHSILEGGKFLNSSEAALNLWIS